MLYKYLIAVVALAALAFAVHAASNVYYRGIWITDPNIRLYNLCCAGTVQLPGNNIRLYAQRSGTDLYSGNISSYISPDGLNFSYEPYTIIKGNSTVYPQDPTAVLTQNGIYRIYYIWPTDISKTPHNQVIYTAVSDDGHIFKNITQISDLGNSSFNNASGYVSKPAAGIFPNNTIGIYYMYTSSSQPAEPCGSLFKLATSLNGVHFTNDGCVNFVSGKSYNFIDPTWTMLPNGSVIMVSASPSPIFDTGGYALGLYVSYSTDNTYLNFTTPKLIIQPTKASTLNSIDLLQNPDLLRLANGTYRLYYDVFPAAKGSNYFTPSNYVYIDSASWIPLQEIGSNSTSTSSTSSSTLRSTASTSTQSSTTATTTIAQQQRQWYENGYVIIIATIVVIAALVAVFYYLSKRRA